MRILDRRNYYSRKTLRWLGERSGQTVLLEQTESCLRVLLSGGDGAERALCRIPLHGSVLRQAELKNGAVRLLLSCGSEITLLRLRPEEEAEAERTAFSLCGTVTDVCFAGENGCFVRTQADAEHAPLYRALEQMTGRSAFLFYVEPREELCVPVQDLRLLDALPREFVFSADGTSFCTVLSAQEQPESAAPQSRLAFASWEQLHRALLCSAEELPLQFPVCAENGGTLRLLGSDGERVFLADGSARSAWSLQLSAGTAERIAVAEEEECFAFVAGLGCCIVRKNGGRSLLRTADGARELSFPEKLGVPSAWVGERGLLAHHENGAVCYDTATKQTTVYEGNAEFLPDGLLLS